MKKKSGTGRSKILGDGKRDLRELKLTIWRQKAKNKENEHLSYRKARFFEGSIAKE
jgi:hypothetical protein